ncbi:MAG: hypothetical protein KKF74_00505 [Nanoarchaeota archaeon]|nr:hypothetical protein [Nanoarchaeota archaeon]
MKFNAQVVPDKCVKETSLLLQKISQLEDEKNKVESPLKKFLNSFIEKHKKDLESLSHLTDIRYDEEDIFNLLLGLGIKTSQKKLERYLYPFSETDILEYIFSNQKTYSKLPKNLRMNGKTYLDLKKDYEKGLNEIGFKRDFDSLFVYHEKDWVLLKLFGKFHGDKNLDESCCLSFNAKKNIKNKVDSLKSKIVKEKNDIYTPIILGMLGKDYNAIYWSPAEVPFCIGWTHPSFSKYGKWTLVDKNDLSTNILILYNYFSKIKTVQFDITRTPNFPRGIGFASYDLSFFNCDWAGKGTTYKASDLALKNNGILMTSRENIKKLKEMSGNNYSLIFDPEVNFPDYVLLSKEK